MIFKIQIFSALHSNVYKQVQFGLEVYWELSLTWEILTFCAVIEPVKPYPIQTSV